MFFVYWERDKNEDPDVSKKEPDWIDWKPISDPEEYRKMFNAPAGVKAAGEASTAYLANPSCAEKIFRFNPEMKIIAILRNPVSRAFSNYLMYVRMGHEEKDFKEVVQEELNGQRNYLPQGRHYIKLGFYHDALKTYFDVFGRDKVKVYLMEDLKNRPEWLFQDVFRFLGVDDTFVPNTSEKLNVNEKVTKNNAFKRFLIRLAYNSRFMNYIPKSWTRPKGEVLKLDESLRIQLRDHYRDEILKLQELLGRDLSAWLK